MENRDKRSLAAPCGIYCGECPLFKAGDNPVVMEALISRGMLREILPCPGCRAVEGNCPVIASRCETFSCVQRHKVDFCFRCPEFPCVRLNPSADRAGVLPHNIKVFNLCCIRERGLDRFIEEAALIQARYYKGTMEIGKGPQINGD